MAYKTIFEKVRENQTGNPSREWYRTAVFNDDAIRYSNDPRLLITEEQSDDADLVKGKDSNVMRVYPQLFSLMLYGYRAKWREELPYYDKYPLAFVLDVNPKYFFALNLHYYAPEQRVGIVQDLAKSKLRRFEKGAHKYLLTEVNTPYLDLAQQEWDTICLLPLEEFVMDLGGLEVPIPSNKIWR